MIHGSQGLAIFIGHIESTVYHTDNQPEIYILRNMIASFLGHVIWE